MYFLSIHILQHFSVAFLQQFFTSIMYTQAMHSDNSSYVHYVLTEEIVIVVHMHTYTTVFAETCHVCNSLCTRLLILHSRTIHAQYLYWSV